MGPFERGLGKLVPAEAQLWQDPIPVVNHDLVSDADVADLKAKLLDCGVTVSELINTAWASASTFRGSDKRGGANGARVRLAPQKDWAANQPDALASALGKIEAVQVAFNAAGGPQISLADTIVLGGVAAVEKAADAAGHAVAVPFTAGRMDASQEQTDVHSVDALELKADGFRNYLRAGQARAASELLVDRAQLLTLTAPEMTVLVGGMRVLGAGAGTAGQFTNNVGALTTDFFVNLLNMGTQWTKSGDMFEGRDDAGNVKWTATEVDLIFGSNSVLRALSEVYAADDAKGKFVADFVAAWTKVMNLDRFDIA
jgi:catalase-peroxidase